MSKISHNKEKTKAKIVRRFKGFGMESDVLINKIIRLTTIEGLAMK
jgi:hypothetical protein